MRSLGISSDEATYSIAELFEEVRESSLGWTGGLGLGWVVTRRLTLVADEGRPQTATSTLAQPSQARIVRSHSIPIAQDCPLISLDQPTQTRHVSLVPSWDASCLTGRRPLSVSSSA